MNVEVKIAKEMALFCELGAHPVRHGGVILIPKSEIAGCASGLLARGIRILGFDGFLLYPGDKIQPFIDGSIDYSVYGQPSQDEVALFLSQCPEVLTHFEVVIET
jgi:hypothetical protein